MTGIKVKFSGGRIPPQSDLRVEAPLMSHKRKYVGKKVQTFQVCTYNCRSLLGNARLEEIELELEKINWSVVGLSEVRRKGENCLHLKSGNMFYFCGEPEGKLNGVGFLIHRSIIDKISVIEGTSSRIARLVLNLSKRYKMQIVQVYAPTSSHTDDEVETFYEHLDNTCKKGSDCHFQLVIGDFNGKVGARKQGDSVVGKHGIDVRNDRGERLVQFAEYTNMPIMNTFFKKHPSRKWTWRSPNHSVKNEIDFILSSIPAIVKDVSVLNKFNTGSDHRLVRARIEIDVREERKKLIKRKRYDINLQNLEINKHEFQTLLQSKLHVTKDEELAEMLVVSAQEVGGLCKKNYQPNKLSDKTKTLLQRRREMKIKTDRDMIEYSELCKAVRKEMKADLQKFNEDTLRKSLENKTSFRIARRILSIGNKQIIALDGHNGRITEKEEILNFIRDFFSNLYAKPKENWTAPDLNNVSKVPDILPSEVRCAIDSMKKGTVSGYDGLCVDILKLVGEETMNHLAKIFTSCLCSASLPGSWNIAKIILLHKKGSIHDIKNYRPISLLSVLYKILTKILLNRIGSTLDSAQPLEQAGFRRNFSTIDHILTLREVISRANEYQMPLCIAFVDFEKAFDSVSHAAVMQALAEQGVEATYIRILNNIYETSSAFVHVGESTQRFHIGRGVKQGDPISPKLFTAVLEMAMSKLDWDGKGIRINGRRLNNLRFADDIVLLSNNNEELQTLVTGLTSECQSVGLNMNLSKTKVMSNKWIPPDNVTIKNTTLEWVSEYIYLGQIINMKGDIRPEIFRRIKLGWQAFGRNSLVFKSKMPVNLKKTVFDQSILPVLTYGCETWTLNEFTKRKLRTAQRGMERSMLGFTRKDRKRAKDIRSVTKVNDILERVYTLKWRWAGHIARRKEDRWTKFVLEWSPRELQRPRGRPPDRWDKDIKKVAGITWQRTAQDRSTWRKLLKVYLDHRLKEATSLSD